MSMAKKMISRLSVLAVLMVFFAACSKQTEYTNVIPADATAVASIDLKSLANKAGMNDKENEAAKQKLLEALKSPIFMAYHDGQPFNDNMYRPCPMLENPQKLREMVEKSGAHSTDLQSPESAEHLCAKCDRYAENWKPVAEEMWKEDQERKAVKKVC